MQLTAIIIPLYKDHFNAAEQIAFQQCIKVLNKYPIIIIKPHSLNTDGLLANHLALGIETFDDQYFLSTSGYNRLLLSEFFYERFSTYEYMLIVQLDVFIFRDELMEWCQRGYDYIGAPHFNNTQRWAEKKKMQRFRVSHLFQRPLLNGGLSLRRTNACLQLLRVYHRFYKQWPGNEDGFFSLHFPRLLPFRCLMHLPTPLEALHFSIEVEPRQSVGLIGGKLPMGCHAWEVYDLDFWRPIFLEYGYRI